MVKFTFDAGHWIHEPGKRCDKSIDPNQTREWTLNNRILTKVMSLLAEKYTDYQAIRLDDPTGTTNISVSRRAAMANKEGSIQHISIHHNAGVYLKPKGGIVTFVAPNASQKSKDFASSLWKNTVQLTGLKDTVDGHNNTHDYTIVSKTNMPAVILECGFMDSPIDTPIILKESHANACAQAIVKTLADFYNLTERTKWYRVQVGAYISKDNAQKKLQELHKAGFIGAYIKEEY